MQPPHATSTAAAPAASRAAFWLMLQRVAVMAGAVDAIFLVVFWLLDMPVVALLNLVSIATYGAAYLLLKRRRNLPAVLLMWTEVLVHTLTCTVLFGWDSGVHYFLLVFLPAVAVSRSARHAVGAMAFVLVTYLALDVATQLLPVMYVLPPEVLMGIRWLSIAVVFLMFGYTGRYYVARVKDTEARLRELATTDPLSGLLNRRQFTELAQRELERAKREGHAPAIAIADIDHFKQVNDQHGHAAGDRVIRHVADVMRRELRPHDLVGRWGGEEFILMLPASDAAGAAAACERLRAAVQRTACALDPCGPLSVTLSLGVHLPGPGEALEDTINHADMALYRAKRLGRNRVEVANPPPVEAAA